MIDRIVRKTYYQVKNKTEMKRLGDKAFNEAIKEGKAIQEAEFRREMAHLDFDEVINVCVRADELFSMNGFDMGFSSSHYDSYVKNTQVTRKLHALKLLDTFDKLRGDGVLKRIKNIFTADKWKLIDGLVRQDEELLTVLRYERDVLEKEGALPHKVRVESWTSSSEIFNLNSHSQVIWADKYKIKEIRVSFLDINSMLDANIKKKSDIEVTKQTKHSFGVYALLHELGHLQKQVNFTTSSGIIQECVKFLNMELDSVDLNIIEAMPSEADIALENSFLNELFADVWSVLKMKQREAGHGEPFYNVGADKIRIWAQNWRIHERLVGGLDATHQTEKGLDLVGYVDKNGLIDKTPAELVEIAYKLTIASYLASKLSGIGPSNTLTEKALKKNTEEIDFLKNVVTLELLEQLPQAKKEDAQQLEIPFFEESTPGRKMKI